MLPLRNFKIQPGCRGPDSPGCEAPSPGHKRMRRRGTHSSPHHPPTTSNYSVTGQKNTVLLPSKIAEHALCIRADSDVPWLHDRINNTSLNCCIYWEFNSRSLTPCGPGDPTFRFYWKSGFREAQVGKWQCECPKSSCQAPLDPPPQLKYLGFYGDNGKEMETTKDHRDYIRVI